MEKDVGGPVPANEPPQLAATWARVRGRLREEVGEIEYRTWLRQMILLGIEGEEAVITLPTRFLRDWVKMHYGDRLRVLMQLDIPSIRRVDVRVAPAMRGEQAAGDEAGATQPPAGLAEPLTPHATPAPEPRAEPRHDWSAPLDTRFTFDTFVVGKPNEFAYACARRVTEHAPVPAFNPLFLYGGVGLGKTHLMHSIAWAIREATPERTIAYMTAEKFMSLFITAIRSQSTMEFKEIRAVDVLMIDDLQFLINKDNTQEEFFHTFNALIGAGKQIVVSADKSPSDLNGIEDRLRTRLGGGMVADLHATTYELRLSILEAKAASAGVGISKRVLEFLAHKVTSNVRDIEGALNRLIGHANLFGREVTLETAQDVLKDVIRAHDRKLTIGEIQKRVAEHFNIRLTDMSSARRARNVARPRQVAMYLAKKLTQRSLPEIGKQFGNRDHTTVIHAVTRITELMKVDSGFAEDVELLQKMLEVS